MTFRLEHHHKILTVLSSLDDEQKSKIFSLVSLSRL